MIQTETGTFSLPAALPLQTGGLLFHGEVAWERYGAPAPRNTVVLLHDFAHSHRALDESPDGWLGIHGWGRELIGEGKALRPHAAAILSVGLIGTPFGSTSPVSVDRKTGASIGSEFPRLHVDDLARSVGGLIKGLGVESVRCVVGVGFGGMVALRLAALFPGSVRAVAALGAARSLTDGVRDQLDVASVRLHPRDGQEPIDRRALLREFHLGLLQRMLSRQNLRSLFADVESGQRVLEDVATRFAQQFDPLSYGALAQAYSQCDLKPSLEKVQCKVLLVASSTDTLAPPTRVRDLYHALTAEHVNASFTELHSDAGHAAVLTEPTRLRQTVGQFVASISKRT